MRTILNRSVVTLYRYVAIVVLYGVLIGTVSFGGYMAFYAINSSWVTPVVLSPNDKDALDLTGKLLSTQSSLEGLKLDVTHLQQSLAEAEQHKAGLEQLSPALNAAIARENAHRKTSGVVLNALTHQKRQDNAQTADLIENLKFVDREIDQELQSGLITKVDAIQAKAQLTKTQSELTDSEISSVMLKDNVAEKTTLSTSYLEILNKKVELASEISSLNITIAANKAQIQAEQEQIRRLDNAVKVATETPLYAAITSGRTNIALVPYDNSSVAVEGAPVYDCYLSFIGCRQVGSVKRIYTGEQHATHPIFHTDLRGVLVQLQLTNPEAAKSRTLFVGKKPLFL